MLTPLADNRLCKKKLQEAIIQDFHEKNSITKTIESMVFITDGCSFHCAHTWRKSGFSICSRHLVTSKEQLNSIFFLEKRPCLHYTSTTWKKQPYNIKTIITTDDWDRIKGSKKQWGLLITRLKGEERSKECVHCVLVDLPPGRSSQPWRFFNLT